MKNVFFPMTKLSDVAIRSMTVLFWQAIYIKQCRWEYYLNMIKQITNKTKILKFIGLFLDISYDQELANAAKLEQQIKSIVRQKYSQINFESNWIRKNLLLNLIRLSLFGAVRAGGFQKSHHPSYIKSGVSVL